LIWCWFHAGCGASPSSIRGDQGSAAAKTVKADDLLIVDVAEARKQLKALILDLDEQRPNGRVKGVIGGEPVFKGTRIHGRG
jgi:hypothetical protein